MSGVCCLRFDPFSTLAWRQRYVKDFIACKKLPFLLALRLWDVSRGPSSARNVPCGERTRGNGCFRRLRNGVKNIPYQGIGTVWNKMNLRTAAVLFLTQPQIDTCSFFGVNRHLNMYSKACSAQWLHVYVAKLKVFCSIPSGKWLENPPLRVRNQRWKTSNMTSNTYHVISSRLPVVFA